MTDRTLSLLGLALRGGSLAVGEEPVGEACRTGRAKLVLAAADAAGNSADRAKRLAERAGIPFAVLPRTKEQTGFALGRASCAVLAVTDSGLAAAVEERLEAEDGRLKLLSDSPGPTDTRRTAPSAKQRNNRRWPV